MKLSEAIREGAKLRPQLRRPNEGDYGFSANREISSCAMGAAFEAAGLVKVFDAGNDWPDQETAKDVNVFHIWPVLYRQLEDEELVKLGLRWCCAVIRFDPMLSEVITHLNDYHGWTREQIADWVEGIERQHGY